MKTIAAILLFSIYSLSTFGIALKGFYCCGKLKSVTVTLADEGKNKCNKNNNEKGCCKTKYQFYKVKDNHITAAELTTPIKYNTDNLIFYSFYPYVSFPLQEIDIINASHAPPLYSGVSLYISNCIFRI